MFFSISDRVHYFVVKGLNVYYVKEIQFELGTSLRVRSSQLKYSRGERHDYGKEICYGFRNHR